MFKIVKLVVLVLVAIGVIRAVARYTSDSETAGAGDLAASFVGAIEDITYRWIPVVVDAGHSFVEFLSGLAT